MNRYTWRTLSLEIVMMVVAIIFAFPLYILVNLALSSPNSAQTPLIPTAAPTLDNFVRAWQEAGLGSAILNSAIVTVLSVVIIVVISSMAAYPLSRVTSRLSTLAFWTIMVGLLIPFQLAMIPLYQTIRDMGLLGSIWSLVIFYAGVQVPFTVFLYTGFLRAMPRDYEEAAWMDGASPLLAFWKVVFPMLRPITGTVVILNSIHVWNDFFTPLLYLSGSANQTIPVALYAFVGEFTADWPLVFAGLVIGIIPILIAYFLMQKTIIQGFAGGLKG